MDRPSSFHLRPYHPSDAPRVVDLVNADADRTLGIQRAVIDAVGRIRLIRYVPPDSNKVVALDRRDRIVGYAYLADREQRVISEIGGAVAPSNWGQGIGSMLLDWGYQQASIMSRKAHPGVRTVIQATLFEGEQPARWLYKRFGYSIVREWSHMMVHLESPPATPEIPPGMNLRELDLDKDWDVIGPVMDEAFSDHWGAIDLPEMTEEESEPDDNEPEDDSYSNSPGYCFVLLDGNAVTGGILCNAKLVERGDTGRVGSVFVARRYRRQGVGRTLMLAAFDSFWRSGLRRIILDTDTHSFTQAPRFYESLGMRLYRREFVYEKEVRPGQEVRRLEL